MSRYETHGKFNSEASVTYDWTYGRNGIVVPPNNAGVPLPVLPPANVPPTLAHIANADDYFARLKGTASNVAIQISLEDLLTHDPLRIWTSSTSQSSWTCSRIQVQDNSGPCEFNPRYSSTQAGIWNLLPLLTNLPAGAPPWLQQFTNNLQHNLQQIMDNNTAALRGEIAAVHQEVVVLRQDIVGLRDWLDNVKNDVTDQISQLEESTDALNIIISKVCILHMNLDVH